MGNVAGSQIRAFCADNSTCWNLDGSTGAHTLGKSATSPTSHIVYGNITQTGNADITQSIITTGAGNGAILDVTAQTGGFDPKARFNVGAQSYTMGIDNSVSDRFSMAASGGLGSSDFLTADSSANVSILNGVVGLVGATPVTDSAVEVRGATKTCIRCPKLKETTSESIGTPSIGQCVFNTTTPALNVYNGSTWVKAGGGLDKWATSTNYKTDDVVWLSTDNKIYRALSDFTSGGSFTPGNWQELSEKLVLLDEDDMASDSATSVPSQQSVKAYVDANIDLVATSGLQHGGTCSINADTTKFDVSAGKGIITDFSTPSAPSSTAVTFSGGTAISVTNIASADITYVYVNSSGTVTQSTSAPTPNTLRSSIYLCRLGHTNRSNVTVVLNNPTVIAQRGNQTDDLMRALGIFNISGNDFSANGANLSLNKSAGVLFDTGSNFTTDPENPSQVTIGASTPVTFRYFDRDSFEATNRTTLLTDTFDLAGAPTVFGGSNNQATVQRVYVFPSGNIRIAYGQTIYSTLADAKAGIATQPFVKNPAVSGGILRAFVLVTKGCTSLQNTACSSIIQVGKFGEEASGSGGQAATTLQAAYNNSTDGAIILDSTRTGIKIRDASTPTAANLINVTNSAGTTSYFSADVNGPKKTVDSVSVKLGSNPDAMNLYADPSFEVGITEGTATTCAASSESTVVMISPENKKSLKLACTASTGNWTGSAKSTTQAATTQGLVQAWIKTSQSGVKFIPRINGVDQTAIQLDVASDNVWRLYSIPVVLGATSVSYKVSASTSITGDIYIDDVYVGPKSLRTSIGVDTPWVDDSANFTPNNFGTVTNKQIFSRRVGDELQVRGRFTNGTVAAATASIDLTGYKIDLTKIPTTVANTARLGKFDDLVNATFGASSKSMVFSDGTDNDTIFISNAGNGSGYNKANANALATSSGGVAFEFSVPIAGWSSTFDYYTANPMDGANWQSYTPSTTGVGTPSGVSFKYRRNGDTLDVIGFFTTGTVSASLVSVSLPSSLTIDSDKITQNNTTSNPGTLVGRAQGAGFANHAVNIITATGTSTSLVYFGTPDAGTNQLTPQNGNGIFTSSEKIAVKFSVPISGWSAPQITGTFKDVVTTPNSSNGKPVIYSASVSGAGVVSNEIGDFINGNAALSVSQFTLTWNSVFSATPNCTVTPLATDPQNICVRNSISSTTGVWTCYESSAGAASNTGFDIVCHGLAP